jgi:archaemetzincin
VNFLYLVPIGGVAPQLLAWIERAAADWFPFPIRQLPAVPLPQGAYEPARGQYRSVEILKTLSRHAPADAARILGITEADLSIPMLTFLFGQAQLDGPVAVISLCRLRQEFYGLPPDEALLRERIVKEMLHELGHTFGLTHCGDTNCAMSLSTHVEFVDAKSARYCARCGNHLARRAGAMEGTEIYEKPVADSHRR